MTHEGPEDDWTRVLDVNLNGVWRCQRAQLKVMMKQEYAFLQLPRKSKLNFDLGI